ncbi:MAG TPA: DUF3828 domain-containing protein [Pyrinomonadaceae bacterium]|nr:DUF3828 domain-containing protein [Pyrinomonadaceae bacterium]
MRALVLSASLVGCGALVAPSRAQARQAGAEASRGAAGPEDVVRGFYSFYLGELNKDNWTPLGKRREALKYLTPEFYRRAPGLIEKWMADIFICAQDWDPKWAETFTVGRAALRGSKATTVVRLPPFGGGDPSTAIKIKVTLVTRRDGWKINSTDCVM